MTTDADQTRLTAVPPSPPERADEMNGFEEVVNFVLDVLPKWFFVAVIALTLAAGAVEMFVELGPWWSVVVTAGLVGAGISAGTRLKRLPLVSVFLPSRTATRPVNPEESR